MKKILFSGISMATLLCAMVITTLFSSCNSKDDEQITDQQPVELKITAGIVATRAVNASWTAGDKIGVFALDGTTAEYSNIPYSTTNGDGNFTADDGQNIMLPYDGSSRTVAAYYPYAAGASAGTYSIDVSNQNDQEAIDLLVVTPVSNVSKKSPIAALDFAHKLVKVELTLKPGEGITASQLAYLKVTISNQYTKGTCDVINNGNVVASGNNNNTVTFETSADGTTSEAILLPAATTENMILTFDVPGAGTYTWEVNSAAKSKSFGAGNKYKYDISINKTTLTVNSSIEDWNDGNGGENGNAL